MDSRIRFIVIRRQFNDLTEKLEKAEQRVEELEFEIEKLKESNSEKL